MIPWRMQTDGNGAYSMPRKGQAQPEQIVAKSARPSVLDKLKAPPVRGTQDKPHKKEMEVR